MRTFLLMMVVISSFFVLNASAVDLPAIPAAATTASPASATANTVNAAPAQSSSVQANLTLKQEDQRLYAHVLIEQPQNEQGKIRIDWTPPLHSSCDKSSYSLSYQGKKFHTQAYRTLGHGLISGKSVTCIGTWQAAVVNEQGAVLATATITIDSVDSFATNTAKKMHSLAAIA